LHPLFLLPRTATALLLQFSGIVHSRWHAGYVALSRPAAHERHSVCSYFAGQKEQSAVVQLNVHVQLQPVLRFPLTRDAWSVQLPAIVQSSEQFGYESKALMHLPQSALALYGHGHTPHVGPVHWLRHTVQLHPIVWSPAICAALPLQCSVLLHASPQRG
jgi:hypothetical protein